MNGVSRLLSLALLGAALHWAPAQAEEQPRLFELLGQPGYKATWHAMFKGESDVPKWVSDASGPSSPSTSLSLEGQPYVLANSCKPHDCGNNRL
ncbi:lysozyme inhibitor, partial [Pseudomonas aeruginosa]